MKKTNITQEQLVMPREKCMQLGAGALSDEELLAIILRTGTPGRPVLSLSSDILHMNPQFDGLVGLMYYDYAEYARIPGIGDCKAVELYAVGEIARRIWNRSKRKEIISFNSAEKVMEYFKEDLRYLDREVIHVLYLDNRTQLIRDIRLSEGTCCQSAVSARDVFIEALRLRAVCMIIVHNHPSGDPTPSEADISFTKELYKGGGLIGVALLDHVIIGDNCYYSFKEHQII